MRVVWTRALGSQRALDSLLTFVDVGALNALATEVSAPARADSLGLRNAWRATATRLQATSLRWFPAIALAELRPEGAAATHEVDARGDTATDLVAGVALDLDLPQDGYAAAGFCDATYHEGLRALALDSVEAARLGALPTAGGARYDSLLERGLLARYDAALEDLVAQRAAALRAELRRLSPDLRFAFRSAQVPSDWFSLGLLRGFSAPDAPILLWTREPRVRDILEYYRKTRGIFTLSAVGLTPDRVAPSEWPRLRRVAFAEHDGFWLPWTDAPPARAMRADSLGRLLRRLSK